MGVQRVLVDTGPLVALLNKRDRWHGRSAQFFDAFSGIALTTWAVVTETSHLLPAHRRDTLLGWLEAGGIRIAHVPEVELRALRVLITRFRDTPMDLADATLVWLAEREHLLDIITVDRGFDAYRTAAGGRFTNHLA